jgi:hypothetical protein
MIWKMIFLCGLGGSCLSLFKVSILRLQEDTRDYIVKHGIVDLGQDVLGVGLDEDGACSGEDLLSKVFGVVGEEWCEKFGKGFVYFGFVFLFEVRITVKRTFT